MFILSCPNSDVVIEIPFARSIREPTVSRYKTITRLQRSRCRRLRNQAPLDANPYPPSASIVTTQAWPSRSGT